ncbi:MAG: hypothetical protein R2751_15870 [Bacteroidales bacterium]
MPGFLFALLLLGCSCDKKEPEGISVDFRMVDEAEGPSTFNDTDSVFFEFHLSNFSGQPSTYLLPVEFTQYLRLYRQEDAGTYVFCGEPEYDCVTVSDIRPLGIGATVLIGRIPWSWLTEHGWPEMETGFYYVGDTLPLMVGDEFRFFVERQYVEIE